MAPPRRGRHRRDRDPRLRGRTRPGRLVRRAPQLSGTPERAGTRPGTGRDGRPPRWCRRRGPRPVLERGQWLPPLLGPDGGTPTIADRMSSNADASVADDDAGTPPPGRLRWLRAAFIVMALALAALAMA